MEARQLITTPFTPESTAEDVVAGIDLAGVRAVVTGSSSGIGLETARVLAGAGAEVHLAVRNLDAGAEAAAQVCESAGHKDVHVRYLDLSDQGSVARFAEEWDGPLHILVNNAATIPSSLSRTAEGWELQFATNHIGHFHLAVGLYAALAAGAAERGEARIAALTSGAHMRSPIVFEDIHYENRPYDMQQAYAQSKTANVLFAVEATRRWESEGIFANAVNPGAVGGTLLNRDASAQQKEYLAKAEAAGVFKWKTLGQGAATTLTAAVDPRFARTGGHYLDACQEMPTVPNHTELLESPRGVKEWALDPEIAQRLWRLSSEMIAAR